MFGRKGSAASPSRSVTNPTQPGNSGRELGGRGGTVSTAEHSATHTGCVCVSAGLRLPPAAFFEKHQCVWTSGG